MHPSLQWHPLSASDLDSVAAIAARVHTDLPERTEVFAEKFRLAPDCCRKLMQGATCVGYGLAHPWELNSIPPLDTFLTTLPASPDCLYVHDIALLPEARGSGASGIYLDHLADVARTLGLGALAATSVHGTDVYWKRFGFVVTPEPSLAAKLASYGSTAKYIVRTLKPDPASDTPARSVQPKAERPRSNDPLHGITLERLLTELVDHHGWRWLARQVEIRCFMFDPSISSSLKFLRKTPWARTKVEQLYVDWKKSGS